MTDRVSIRSRLHLLPLAAAFLGLTLFLCAMWGLEQWGEGDEVLLWPAWLITRGYVPHRDFFFLRPPLIPYLSAGLTLLTGSVPRSSWAISLAAAWLTLLGIYKLGLDLFARRGPAVGASVFFVFWAPLWQAQWWNYGQWMLPFLVWGAVFAHRALDREEAPATSLAAGFVLGLGSLVRLHVAFFAVLFMLFFFRRKPVRETLCYAAGLFMPWILASAWFLLQGSWRDFIRQCILLYLRKAAVYDFRVSDVSWRMLPWAAILPCALSLFRRWRDHEDRWSNPRLFILGCAVATIPMVYPYVSPSYLLPGLPFLSLALAAWAWDLRGAPAAHGAAGILLASILTVWIPGKVYPACLRETVGNTRSLDPLVLWIRRNSEPDDQILFIGLPGVVHWLARRLPVKTSMDLGYTEDRFELGGVNANVLRCLERTEADTVFVNSPPMEPDFPINGSEVSALLRKRGYRLVDRAGFPNTPHGDFFLELYRLHGAP